MTVRAQAEVNLSAIERNVARLRRELTGATALCAVVKADAYGHGALPVARTALSAGASWLAVATAGEADELRRGGIESRILVMGALSREELPLALAAGADIVAWREEFVEAAAEAGAQAGHPVRVHVKLDTGMGRLGTREVTVAGAVAEAVAAAPALQLSGAMTHFATADEDDDEFMAEQLARYRPFVSELRRAAPGLVVHAANSAATLRDPATHFDLVRCGIAVYGCDPANVDPARHGLEPALALRSYAAAVKQAQAGDSAGYGRTFVAARDTWLATLPIGYADGVRRGLSNNAEVLVGGRRRPLVGNVSMDNITVELGPEPDVEVGETAWLIGGEGRERVTAEELARRIGTINYEIVCGISRRVPRIYHRDGAPA